MGGPFKTLKSKSQNQWQNQAETLKSRQIPAHDRKLVSDIFASNRRSIGGETVIRVTRAGVDPVAEWNHLADPMSGMLHRVWASTRSIGFPHRLPLLLLPGISDCWLVVHLNTSHSLTLTDTDTHIVSDADTYTYTHTDAHTATHTHTHTHSHAQ